MLMKSNYKERNNLTWENKKRLQKYIASRHTPAAFTDLITNQPDRRITDEMFAVEAEKVLGFHITTGNVSSIRTVVHGAWQREPLEETRDRAEYRARMREAFLSDAPAPPSLVNPQPEPDEVVEDTVEARLTKIEKRVDRHYASLLTHKKFIESVYDRVRDLLGQLGEFEAQARLINEAKDGRPEESEK